MRDADSWSLENVVEGKIFDSGEQYLVELGNLSFLDFFEGARIIIPRIQCNMEEGIDATREVGT